MTADAQLPHITCPSSLIASCAPLLGFVPRDCVVAFIHGVPGRRAPVVLRVDLPSAGSAALAARHTAASIAGTAGVAADVVAWVSADSTATRRTLPSTGFLTGMLESLAVVGVEVATMLSTNGQVWWSHACDEPACCSEQATAVDTNRVTAVQAEYVFAGYAPLSGREQVAQRLTRDGGLNSDVRRRLGAGRGVMPTQRWRDTQVRILTDVLQSDAPCDAPVRPLTPAMATRLHRGLADIRVRDVVLHRLVVAGRDCDRCWSGTIEVLCQAVRSAPYGWSAPAASVLALVAWLRGEGSLATLSLERALDEDPDYRLATLAAEMMRRGTDPRDWRASLTRLPESECRDPGGR